MSMFLDFEIIQPKNGSILAKLVVRPNKIVIISMKTGFFASQDVPIENCANISC